MKSLSRVGVGLSVIFGCLLLALFVELYYLLWWKKKKRIIMAANASSSFDQGRPNLISGISDVDSKSLCEPQQLGGDLNNLLGSNKEFQFKPPEQDGVAAEGQGPGPEAEVHMIPGPPRLLFTIVEETKEDLESDDGKSDGAKVKRSLSDYLAAVESQTPYMTPVTSPSLFIPSVTPNGTSTGKPCPNRGVGSRFNPWSFESCRDAEFNRKRCSPPPTFKFLQDAEEKLRRKLLESEQVRKINGDHPLPSSMRLAVAAEQLITITISKPPVTPRVATVLVRAIVLASLVLSLAIITTNTTTFQVGLQLQVEVKFMDVYSYRYMLGTLVIGAAYSYGVCTANQLSGGDGGLVFVFFGDKIVLYFLATGMAAAFGATKDLKATFEGSGSNVDKFFDKGYVAAGLLFFSFVCTMLLSVLSSFSLPTNI